MYAPGIFPSSGLKTSKELAIPDHLFTEALGAFRVGDQLTVEVIDSAAKVICDWVNALETTVNDEYRKRKTRRL